TLPIPALWELQTASSCDHTPPARAVGLIPDPMTRPLRSIAITATSTLLRVVPPLDRASVLSASRLVALGPFPLHRDRRFPQFNIGARTKLALPLCRTSHGQSAGPRHACPGIALTPGFDVV